MTWRLKLFTVPLEAGTENRRISKTFEKIVETVLKEEILQLLMIENVKGFSIYREERGQELECSV